MGHRVVFSSTKHFPRFTLLDYYLHFPAQGVLMSQLCSGYARPVCPAVEPTLSPVIANEPARLFIKDLLQPDLAFHALQILCLTPTANV